MTNRLPGNFLHAAAVKQMLIIPQHFASTSHSRRVFARSLYDVKSRITECEKKYLKKQCGRATTCKHTAAALPVAFPSISHFHAHTRESSARFVAIPIDSYREAENKMRKIGNASELNVSQAASKLNRNGGDNPASRARYTRIIVAQQRVNGII